MELPPRNHAGFWAGPAKNRSGLDVKVDGSGDDVRDLVRGKENKTGKTDR